MTKTETKALIPIGSIAFFVGEVIKTNTFLVHIGEEFFAEMSAFQALLLLAREKIFIHNTC